MVVVSIGHLGYLVHCLYYVVVKMRKPNIMNTTKYSETEHQVHTQGKQTNEI